MSASLRYDGAENVLGTRTEHDITLLAVRCKIAVNRDTSGAITGVEPLQADDKRKRLIEAANRSIEAGRPIEDALLNALAFADLWCELSVIKRSVA